MAEEDLVVLRKRRKALDRAIAALEELERLAPSAGDRPKTPSILVPFPRFKRQRRSQHSKP